MRTSTLMILGGIILVPVSFVPVRIPTRGESQSGSPVQSSRAAKILHYIQQQPNPAAMTRFVNGLIRTGNEVASDILLEKKPAPPFANAFMQDGHLQPPPWTVLALYERSDLSWPPFVYYEYDGIQKQFAILSPVFPVFLVKQIPFVEDGAELICESQLSSPALSSHTLAWRPTSELLIWAKSHGQFRSATLHPPDDPFSIVDEAVGTIESDSEIGRLLGSNGKKRLKTLLQLQCIAMCEGILDEPVLPSIDRIPSNYEIQDAAWSAFRECVRTNPILWNASSERYDRVKR